jgi:hypothetical protein
VLRTALLVLALVVGSVLLVRAVHVHYPLQEWLIWRYAGYWFGAAAFALACLAGGLPLAERLARDFRSSERLLLAGAIGLVVFFEGMFLLGVLRLYHWLFFLLWPLALIAFGARSLLRQARQLQALQRKFRAVPRRGASFVTLLACAFGFLALAVLYSQSIHPLNTSYDARWYHLSLAEQYTAAGGIVRFPDGSYVNAYPQLASFIYAWAFLLPGGTLFDKVALSAHLLFSVFLVILAGVGILTRRVLRRPARGAWAAVFLFPGLFLYDSGLHLGADHMAAFFAVPIALTAHACFSSWERRNWILLAIMIAGAALTKYSVAVLFAVPGVMLGVRVVLGVFRGGVGSMGRCLVPPLLAVGLILVLSAPHWLKNWAFYGSPLYPYAASLFQHPWADYNRRLYETWSSTHEWTPRGTLGQRLKETLAVLPTFAFVPHDWPAFHRNVPVFGFLFSLTGLALPFVRGRTGRIWMLLLATYAGIFLWYWGMHQDRYLQVLLPWMAATTSAILALAWRTSHWAKFPVVALVALQIAWGSDVPFIPGHAMLGKPPTVAAIELAQTGYLGQHANRLRVFEPYQSIGKALPESSRVLLHEHHMSLGLGVVVLQDFAHTQGRIDYGSQSSTGAVYRMLRGMGITHVVWTPRTSLGWSGYAGDLIFFDFLRSHTGAAKHFGGLSLATLQDGPDVNLRAAKALFLACGNPYGKGLYSLASLNFPDIVITDPAAFPKPETPLTASNTAESLAQQARYIIFDPGCGSPLPAAVLKEFAHLATRSTVQLWARKN